MPTDPSAEITQAISRFESAWARGESPQLDAFIPQDQADNIELVAELVAVDLERRLKAGESIRVEAYLQQFPQLGGSPAHVVNLLVAEYQHRSRLNPALAVDEVLERFPQYRDQLLAQLSATDETLIGGEQLVTRSITAAAKGSAGETAGELLQRMVDVGLVSEQTIESRRKSLPANARQDQHLIDELLQRGDVTAWQVKQLRAGQKTFVLENRRYLLLDELGKGGMGTVYRARHVGLNREVALKTIDPKQAKNAQLIGRFQREISVCAKLQHEHIVQAYDMGCHQGVHFLVLEYVHGADLSSIIKRDGPMWPDEVAAVGLQIAAALVYAHGQGIVHRDIKPHNILLSTDGISKLLDMGLASNHANDGAAEALTSLTQTGMVLGTADYMPPEQAADIAKVDGRSDIYSLGATLYYLLTGRPPFPGGDMMSKMHRLANEEPAAIGQLRPDCPRELTDVIERMLAKRPEARYQSAVEVVQALQPLAAERIAGRHVMTRAVHTAAEADTATPYAGTVAVTPFALATDDTVAKSMLRRKSNPTLKKWWIGGAAALLLLMLSFGLIAWSFNSDNPDGVSPDNPGNVLVATITHPFGVRDELPAHYHISGTHPTVTVFSPNATKIATGSIDGRVFVWDIQRNKPVLCYRGHDSAIVGICWSHDGNLIASRDLRNGTIDVWNASSGKRRARTVTSGLTARWNAIAFAPENDELAYTTHKFIHKSSNQAKQDVRRWKLDADEHSLVAIQQVVSSSPVDIGNFRLRYSPDGKYLASWQVGTPFNVYHLKSGKQIIEYDDRRESIHRDVGFLPDGRIAVVNEREAKFFDSQTGEPIELKPFPSELLPTAKADIYYGLAVGRNGRQLLSWIRNHKARLFDLASWKFSSPSSSELVSSAGGYWHASPDLSQVAVVANSFAAIIPTADPSQRTILRFNSQIGFSDRGGAVLEPVVVGGGRYLRDMRADACWDLHDGSSFFQFPKVARVRPDGSIDAVIVGTNSGSARILRYAGAEAVRQGKFDAVCELKEPQDYVRNLHWTADGQLVYAQTADKLSLRFWNPATGEIARTIQLPGPTNTYTASAQVNRDGSVFAVQEGTQSAPAIGIYGVSGKLRAITSPPIVYSEFDHTALSPNGDRIITEVNSPERPNLLWDTNSGKLLRETNTEDLPWHDHQPMRISASGRRYAIMDVVFDTKTGKRLWRCPERTHAPYPRTGNFFPNDDYIVLLVDNQYQIWNWKKNVKILSLYLLPDRNWAFVDSQFNVKGTPIAPHYLRLLLRDKTGQELWLKQSEFEKQTGWKNDPDKVRFIMPPAESMPSR